MHRQGFCAVNEGKHTVDSQLAKYSLPAAFSDLCSRKCAPVPFLRFRSRAPVQAATELRAGCTKTSAPSLVKQSTLKQPSQRGAGAYIRLEKCTWAILHITCLSQITFPEEQVDLDQKCKERSLFLIDSIVRSLCEP